MRPLNDEERDLVISKLKRFIGNNVNLLTERKDGSFNFHLNGNRVYYSSARLTNLANTISRKNLISFGTCIGKFTKTKKFHLTITGLDYLALYATHKIWLKPSAEQQFLYGNHVLKSGLARVTENITTHQGVVIYSTSDIPLGFGVTAKSTLDIKKADPMAIVCYNQADIGEYLRDEGSLV